MYLKSDNIENKKCISSIFYFLINSDFFVSKVYVSRTDTCMPLLCPLVDGDDEGEMMTSCRYACDCSTGECQRDGQWYLRVAYPYTGHLCEVRIIP